MRYPYPGVSHTLLTGFLLVQLAASPALAATYTVKTDGTGNYNTLVAAISSTQVVSGDTILVYPGTYRENILSFFGKSITVKSVEGPETTIIDGSIAPASTVLFNAGEGPGTVFSGFTLVKGRGTRVSNQTYGGGLYVTNSSPTLEKLILRENSANFGGGMGIGLNANPVLTAIRIESNTANNAGGGLYINSGDPVITDLVVVGNLTNGSGSDGGGIWASKTDGAWQNLLVADNQALRNGGGIYADGGAFTLRFATIVGNEASVSGAGVYLGSTSPTPGLDSVTISYNTLSNGVDFRTGSIRLDYTNIYGNSSLEYAATSSRPTGSGNVSFEPGFADYSADGNYYNDDFHLVTDSAIKNLGNPLFLDPDGSRADIGYYGGPSAPVGEVTTDTDADGMPDEWETTNGTDPTTDDATLDLDEDGLNNLDEYLLSTNPNDPDTDADGVSDGDEVDAGSDPLDPSDNQPTARIQAVSGAQIGVSVVLDGSSSFDPTGDPLSYTWSISSVPSGSGVSSASIEDSGAAITAFTPDVAGDYQVKLVVSDGIASSSATATIRVGDVANGYDVPGNYATIQAAIEAAPDGTVITVAAGTYNESLDFLGKTLTVISSAGPLKTIVKAASGQPVVKFINGEDIDTHLEGFTLTGGTGYRVSTQTFGGAVYIENSSPTLRNNILSSNSATFGAGIAVYGGGSAPQVDFNRIEKNTAGNDGGGLWLGESSSIIAANNWIMDNKVTLSTGRGGGVYLENSFGKFFNNVVAGNACGATGVGGGFMVDLYSAPELINNTLAYNSSGSANGGGALHLDNAGGIYQNNLLVFSPQGYGYYPRFAVDVVFQYNDVFGNTSGQYYTGVNGGTDLTGRDGNLSVDPLFRQVSKDGVSSNDAYLLAEGSSVINAGDPSIVDPDGSRSDMGAYGGPQANPTALFPDGDGDGMPDWWESAEGTQVLVADGEGDLDGDGLTNLQEYQEGTKPKAADSDQDGVSDSDELNAGTDPTQAGDNRPTAALLVEELELLGGQKATLNGSPSFDPNGDPLSFTWSVLTVPSGSAITQSSLTGADAALVSFLPDRFGTYELSLTVHDGKADSLPVKALVRVVQVLKVPASYETIQAAIDAALDGARIEVTAGTYSELLNYKGKNLWIYAVGGTVILEAPRSGGSLVTFATGEGSRAILEGFTIKAGTGTLKSGARYGGGIYISGAAPTLRELTIDGNKASYGAGVACVAGGKVLLRRSNLTSNIAETQGGGLYAEDCDVTVQASSLVGNSVTDTSTGAGGAAALVTSSGTFENNLLLGNVSAFHGGALYLDASSPTVINNTLVGNEAPSGSALIAQGSTSKVINNLLTHQKGGSVLHNLDEVKALEVFYNLTYSNQGPNAGGTLPDLEGLTGNIEGDPLYVAFSNDGRYSNDDFHLKTGSPAIDTGDPAVLDVNASRSDMGAYGGPGLDYTDLDEDGYTTDEGDCDNSDPSVYPGAKDVGDGKDNDCDGELDEDAVDCSEQPRSVQAPTPRPDDPTPTPTPDPCPDGPTPTPVVDPNDQDGDGYTPRKGDCDDTDPEVNPGMDEVLGNGKDDDCDDCVDKLECPTPTPKPTPTPTPKPEETPTPEPSEAPTEEPSTPTPGDDAGTGCSCTLPADGPAPTLGGLTVGLLGLSVLWRRRRNASR